MKHLLNLLLIALVQLSLSPLVSAQKKISHLSTKAHLASDSKALSKLKMASDYTFSMRSGVYSNLLGSSSVNQNLVWDDPEYIVPIGFEFKLFELPLSQLHIGIGLGALVSSEYDINYEADYLILPFEADIIDRGYNEQISRSPISYALEGSTGSRIFKLEWQNVGFYNELDSLGTSTDFINLQLWLYEENNAIEFHFGPSSVTKPQLVYEEAMGAYIGVSDFNIANAYFLSQSAGDPVLIDTLTEIEGTPSNGMIYRFTPNASNGLEKLAENTFNVYPNPSNGIIEINKAADKSEKLEIRAIDGRLIYQGSFQDKRVEVDLSGEPKGLYIIKVGSAAKSVVRH